MGANGIYGLSGSGLDIDSMVKVGMLKKQNTYDKMYQEETKNSWIKEAYADVYSQINSFKESMATFNKQSTMNAMKATSSSEAVTAAANGAAAAMNHKVKVNEVASNAYLLTKDKITRANEAESAKASYNLSDVAFKSIEKSGDGYKVTYANGTTAEVGEDDKALSFKISDGENEAEISYTFKDLVENGKTLYDLATDINGSGVNITAKYDATTDSFSLYNKTGGEANQIQLTAADDSTAALLNNLDLKAFDGVDELKALKDADGNDVASFVAGKTIGAQGKNGSVTIDGKTYNNLDGNSLSVAGVTYTFNNKTVGDTATISVSQDSDSIVDNVKSFVDEYNKLLDSLQEKYNETAYPDYKPLTKNQEAQMTESQIKAWNEKAKSGMLYHDKNLRDLISNLREAVATAVSSVDPIKKEGKSVSYNSASALGITTTNNKGHLTLNEDKLREALSADPDAVYQVFGKLEYEKDRFGKETNTINTRNTGIANRLYFNVSTNAMNKIKDYAGTSAEVDETSYLGKIITNMQKRMSSFKTQMDAYEKLLYKRYDAMEVALSKLSTQMSYITGER